MRTLLRSLCLSLTTLAVAACGGGGGSQDGSGGQIQVTFSPGAATTSFMQGDSPDDLRIKATFSSLPSQPVFVVIRSDASVLSRADVSTQPTAPNTYGAVIRAESSLAPGVHSGVLTLDLCYDARCSSKVPLTGNQLPYTFTVNPPLMVEWSLDGVDQSPVGTFEKPPEGSVLVGQTLHLSSNYPVAWWASLSGDVRIVLRELTNTDTSWDGTVVFYDSPFSGAGSKMGALRVYAYPLDHAIRQNVPASFDVLVP